LKQKCDLDDLRFHDIRAKSLTDAKRKLGSDYARALGNHASVGAWRQRKATSRPEKGTLLSRSFRQSDYFRQELFSNVM
jgi:hypothetical protein